MSLFDTIFRLIPHGAQKRHLCKSGSEMRSLPKRVGLDFLIVGFGFLIEDSEVTKFVSYFSDLDMENLLAF